MVMVFGKMQWINNDACKPWHRCSPPRIHSWKKAPFLGDSFRWTKKKPIILLFFLLWLLWWARARHEGNPLIKEDIFGQECGGLGYQDENINEFLFLKHNLRRCLAKNVASKLLRWKYIWGAASPSNLLSKKIFIKLHEWLFGCEGRRYIWGSWEMILGERPRAGQGGDFVNWTRADNVVVVVVVVMVVLLLLLLLVALIWCFLLI